MAHRGIAGAALTAAAILWPIAEGFAQKGPVVPTDPFAEGYDMCLETIGHDALAQFISVMEAAGWNAEEYPALGPWTHVAGGSREIGDVVLFAYAEVTAYPSGAFHSYCSYDMNGVAGALDFETIGTRFELDGRVEAGPDGAYGTWEMPLDEGLLVIFAYQEEDYFRFQFNWFEWGEPRG